MVDPKISTISSKIRRSSIHAPSQTTIPNSSCVEDIKIEQTKILNKPSINRPVSNDVARGSAVRRHVRGTNVTLNTNNHDPIVSNVSQRESKIQSHGIETSINPTTKNHDPNSSNKVELKSAVRRHKKRPLTDSSTNDDISIPENNDNLVLAMDGVGGGGYFPTHGNDRKKRRGACNSSKVSQITRINDQPIKIRLDVGHGRPSGHKISSLLSHAIGVQVRKDLPMHSGYWSKVDEIKKDEAIRSLMSYFDFETDETGELETGISKYLQMQFAKLFREFKSELNTYFQDFTPQDAKLHPPIEWQNRKKEEWVTMCDHFLSERFQKQSKVNKVNRGKKQYDHHGGSKPMSLRYEKHVKKGSQFPDIDAFKEAYTKSGVWTNDVVKKKYEEMVSQAKTLLEELAVGYPEGTKIDKIIVPADAGRKIVMNTVGIRPGREIRGLGFGRYRDLGSSKTTQGVASSSRFKELEQQIAEEKTARQDAEQRLRASERKMNALAKALYHQGEEFDESEEDDYDDNITSP